jgi:hypothetical protein
MTLEVQAEIRLKEADPSKAPAPVRVNVKRRSARAGRERRGAAKGEGGEKSGR